MTVTTELKGRLGNNFYQIATCIAYALRYGAGYAIPTSSPHMPGGLNMFRVESTGEMPVSPKKVHENTREGNNRVIGVHTPLEECGQSISLVGYWQSFKYFDDYRSEVIQAFNLPYHRINAVSIHVRRGDYVNLPAFDVLPIDYYDKCIDYFVDKGHDFFVVFSDDIAWCKEQFKIADCKFYFREGFNELEDFIEMSCCRHNIVANSSFSFAAAWLNQNPEKIVLCPDENYCWFNDEYIPDYYTVMSC